MFSQKHNININGHVYTLDRPLVMGILNITPDSFYDGGMYLNEKTIQERVRQMIQEGVDIIDIGGMSSRPGSDEISANEEWNRLKMGLEIIRQTNTEIAISIDTYRASIAAKSIQQFQAGIINDISGGELDPELPIVAAEAQCPYVSMHMKGNPKDMQNDPLDENVLEEVIGYFHKKMHDLKALNLHDIIIDPGFGFGKTIRANYLLLNYLDRFKIFESPILCGFSRKSMIHKKLGIDAKESLNGTSILNTIALNKGCNILRVHDVKAAKEVVELNLFTQEQRNTNW